MTKFTASTILGVVLLFCGFVASDGMASSKYRFGAGYDLVGLSQLVKDGSKYDRQPIWTGGAIVFVNSIPRLGKPGLSESDNLKTSVCLEVMPEQVAILRQLGSLGVSVLGIFHRIGEGVYKGCQNGTLIVQSINISFE